MVEKHVEKAGSVFGFGHKPNRSETLETSIINVHCSQNYCQNVLRNINLQELDIGCCLQCF